MKQKKVVIIIFLVALMVAAIFFAPLVFKPKPGPPQACFGSDCFTVEVARTPSEQERGLMFKEQMGPDKGMLFVFAQSGNYPFWMKNTLIPLDIIWINQNREVVFIAENVQPCKQVDCPLINPATDAKYVLELNGGTASRFKLHLGDKAYFTNLGF